MKEASPNETKPAGTKASSRRGKRSGRRPSKPWYKRRTVIMASCAVACLLLLAAGLVYVTRRLHRPVITILKKEYPICGIDISSHNGIIDFDRVVADSVTFVYIKASEGADFRDRCFSANCDSAGSAGLKVGAYHFFRKNGNGTAQARNFLDAVAGKMLDLPLAIDVEDWGNEDAESEAVVRNNLEEMVTVLQQRGCKVIIYTNKDGYHSYIDEDFSHLDLWLCTFKHPREVKEYDWTILQYSHWGNVDGVQGDVDLNVFDGDSLQWEAWLRKR